MMFSRIARSISRSSSSSLFNATNHGSKRCVSSIANKSMNQQQYHHQLGFLNSYISSFPNYSFSSFSPLSSPNPRFFSTAGNEIKEGKGVKNEAAHVESRNSPSFLNRVYHAAVSPLFHLEDGIREIIDDYVHNEMTRTFVLVLVRLYLLIVIKDVILALLY